MGLGEVGVCVCVEGVVVEGRGVLDRGLLLLPLQVRGMGKKQGDWRV